MTALDKIDPSERAAYLAEACDRDDRLRQRVESLLKAHDDPGSFLESPSPEQRSTAEEPQVVEKPGKVIGPYKLLEQIGEGGFGVVFMAEQQEPLRRRVALKVIKPGMDGRQVIARFEAERQALALMDHPNIAKVFDAGETTSGRPYFVMELVKGLPITEFCDQARLPPRDRLELFASVCQAVQHAHQKGIIHRDIKPSNVLITLHDGKPVAKVIDFGIAKATGVQLTEKTLFTNFAAMLGTPLYMSPEQAGLSGLDTDTRSDIYSLGVLLYELLTGTTPFSKERFQKAAYDEIRRIIREEEPPKPSTRLSDSKDWLASISANRHMEPAKLTKLVRGELDWIVMKALEKDRNRRYETANGFAMDVQRYLADEAVLACPPSTIYRLKKFVRRNKGPMLAASLVLLALVAGIVGTTWQALRAEEARLAETNRAEGERLAKVQAQTNFELANDAVDKFLNKVTANPKLKEKDFFQLRKDLLETAVPFYQKFVEARSDDPELEAARGRAYLRLARVRSAMGDKEGARADYEQMRAIFAKLAAEFPSVPAYRHYLATSHNNFGNLLKDLGQRGEAEAAHGDALAIYKQLAADFPNEPAYREYLANSHNNLGNLLAALGQLGEAEAAYRNALKIQEQLAADFPRMPTYRKDLATSHNNLGVLLANQRKRGEAETVFRAALKIREQLAAEFPRDPAYRQDLAGTHSTLGSLLMGLGQLGEAEAAYRAALKIQEQLAAEFSSVPAYAVDLGGSYSNFGQLVREKAEPRAALDWYAKAIGTLGPVLQKEPRLVTAREFLRNAHWGRAITLDLLQRHAEAVADWDRAIELDDGRRKAEMQQGRRRLLIFGGLNQDYAWTLLWGWPR